MTRKVNIEVYCDITRGEKEVFGVATKHRPDLPKGFDEQIQEWVVSNFEHLEPGESIQQAGEMEYEPNGEIVAFRRS